MPRILLGQMRLHGEQRLGCEPGSVASLELRIPPESVLAFEEGAASASSEAGRLDDTMMFPPGETRSKNDAEIAVVDGGSYVHGGSYVGGGLEIGRSLLRIWGKRVEMSQSTHIPTPGGAARMGRQTFCSATAICSLFSLRAAQYCTLRLRLWERCGRPPCRLPP